MPVLGRDVQQLSGLQHTFAVFGLFEFGKFVEVWRLYIDSASIPK